MIKNQWPICKELGYQTLTLVSPDLHASVSLYLVQLKTQGPSEASTRHKMIFIPNYLPLYQATVCPREDLY